MPYEMTKKSPKCWEVHNTETGTVHAKCTTKTKAEAQLRILRDAEMEKEKGMKKGMSWREYFVANTKGKKFSKENTMQEHMKKLAAEYRKMKE